jgi:hypothetical protein
LVSIKSFGGERKKKNTTTKKQQQQQPEWQKKVGGLKERTQIPLKETVDKYRQSTWQIQNLMFPFIDGPCLAGGAALVTSSDVHPLRAPLKRRHAAC